MEIEIKKMNKNREGNANWIQGVPQFRRNISVACLAPKERQQNLWALRQNRIFTYSFVLSKLNWPKLSVDFFVAFEVLNMPLKYGEWVVGHPIKWIYTLSYSSMRNHRISQWIRISKTNSYNNFSYAIIHIL